MRIDFQGILFLQACFYRAVIPELVVFIVIAFVLFGFISLSEYHLSVYSYIWLEMDELGRCENCNPVSTDWLKTLLKGLF